MPTPLNIHATGVLLGNIGVLLRGASGSGKSILALALLDRCQARNEPSWLVSDDRVEVSGGAQGLLMHTPHSLGGAIELRGRGIVTRPHRESAPLHLVVDLVPDLVRMPEESEFITQLAGVEIPRAPVPRAGVIGLEHQLLLVAEAMRLLNPAATKP